MSIRVHTEFPIAVDSLDHINPYGVINDNNSNPAYVNEVKQHFNDVTINVLDLGCAGGAIVVDHINQQDFAIGIEGSDAVFRGAGKGNWEKYHNKNLFFCDISRPFSITEHETPILFDYIQTWEVLEHIPTDRLDCFFQNIKACMKKSSLFCGSIAMVSCESGNHVSVFFKDEWEKNIQPKRTVV
jgi:cyclopropane fatty-acyl-phospholipid synthase-like methyltransferase